MKQKLHAPLPENHGPNCRMLSFRLRILLSLSSSFCPQEALSANLRASIVHGVWTHLPKRCQGGREASWRFSSTVVLESHYGKAAMLYYIVCQENADCPWSDVYNGVDSQDDVYNVSWHYTSFLNVYNFLVSCEFISPACMHVCHVCAVSTEARRVLDSLKLKLPRESREVCAENSTWLFFMSSEHSFLTAEP